MNRIDIAKKLRIVKQFGGWEELKHGLLFLFFFKYVINISKINLNILLTMTKTNLRQKNN